MTIKIVILPRGFVSVGVFSEDGEWGVLKSSAIVRVWGTTKGLGQIAEDGPTSSTVLDKTPTQRFPLRNVLNTIECDAAKWKKALGAKA